MSRDDITKRGAGGRNTAIPNAFSSLPSEAKPMAVAFRSIALVNLFAKLVRQTSDAGFADYTRHRNAS